LRELESVGASLVGAIDSAPPPDAWSYIQARLQAETVVLKPKKSASLAGAVYALAASIAFVGVVAVFMLGQPNSQSNQYEQMQASINELMAHSRGLEQVVQEVAQQNRQLNAVSRASIERLVWRLSYLDQLIVELEPQRSERPQRIQALWNERVETLNELNDLYYQSVTNPNKSRL